MVLQFGRQVESVFCDALHRLFTSEFILSH